MNKINLTKLNYYYLYYIKVKKTIFNKNYILYLKNNNKKCIG